MNIPGQSLPILGKVQQTAVSLPRMLPAGQSQFTVTAEISDEGVKPPPGDGWWLVGWQAIAIDGAPACVFLWTRPKGGQ